MGDTSFPSTMMAYLEGFRQYFPAQRIAYVRGDVWALALLGATRKRMTNSAHSCVFVEQHLRPCSGTPELQGTMARTDSCTRPRL